MFSTRTTAQGRARRRRLTILCVCAGALALALLATAGAAGASPRSLIFDWLATPSWVQTQAGIGSGDDSAGQVVVQGTDVEFTTGALATAGGSTDLSLTKYKGNVMQWTKTWDGPGHLSDVGEGLALSPDGKYVYVAGALQVTTTPQRVDLVVLKYATTNGRLKWARTFSGPAHVMDAPEAIVVDPLGNVSVVGVSAVSLGSPSHLKVLALSFTSSGVRRFAWLYDGGNAGINIAADAVANSDGSITLCGQLMPASGTPVVTGLVAKISASGRAVWLKEEPGPAGLGAGFTALAERPGGGYYVCGVSMQATHQDGIVYRYTKRGQATVFAVDNGAGGTTSEGLNDIAVTSTKAVIAVGGQWVGADCSSRAIAWNRDGSVIGAATYPLAGYDQFQMVATDGLGGWYTVGTWQAGASDLRLTVLRGSVIPGGGGFASAWELAPSPSNYPTGIAVRGTTVYVAGEAATGGPTGIDQVLLAYIY